MSILKPASFRTGESGVKLGKPRGFFIRRRQPWIWKFLFPNVPFKNMAFTWGDTVYTDRELPKEVIAHEKMHVRQQRYSKVFGFFCILLYKFNRSYRRKCEIEAHIAQVKAGGSLEGAVRSLSSPLYGPMVTEWEARKILR